MKTEKEIIKLLENLIADYLNKKINKAELRYKYQDHCLIRDM